MAASVYLFRIFMRANYRIIEVCKQGKKSRVKVDKGASIAELLKKLKVNRETVIVRKNREIVSEEEGLSEGDRVEIIGVISGG